MPKEVTLLKKKKQELLDRHGEDSCILEARRFSEGLTATEKLAIFVSKGGKYEVICSFPGRETLHANTARITEESEEFLHLVADFGNESLMVRASKIKGRISLVAGVKYVTM